MVYWADRGAFASSTAAGITIDDGGSQTIQGTGMLSVYDVDADGNDDLLAASADGVITVHRSNGDGLGFPEIFHTRNPPGTAVAVGNADGDGQPDLWVRNVVDELAHTTAPSFPADPTTGGTTP